MRPTAPDLGTRPTATMERHTHSQVTQLIGRTELHTPGQVIPLTDQMEVLLPVLEIPPITLTAPLPHVQATPLTTLMEQLALVLAILFIAIKVQKLSPNPALNLAIQSLDAAR
jgi:hypothetical protein